MPFIYEVVFSILESFDELALKQMFHIHWLMKLFSLNVMSTPYEA